MVWAIPIVCAGVCGAYVRSVIAVGFGSRHNCRVRSSTWEAHRPIKFWRERHAVYVVQAVSNFAHLRLSSVATAASFNHGLDSFPGVQTGCYVFAPVAGGLFLLSYHNHVKSCQGIAVAVSASLLRYAA